MSCIDHGIPPLIHDINTIYVFTFNRHEYTMKCVKEFIRILYFTCKVSTD